MQIAPEKEVIHIIKKDGTKEDFNFDKIVTAVKKSAERVMVTFTDEDFKTIHEQVLLHIGKLDKQDIDITEIHNIVEKTLESINSQVSQAYKDYRNYKQDFVHMLDKVYQESQRIMYIGDKSNANADSTLSSTKRSLIFDELGKELYKKFFLTKDELQAVKDGYIYTHDANARLLSTNCCIADIKSVLSGGFEMGNIRYTEPKTLDVAFNVISDIVMSMASQQYGGYSIGEVDKILEPYAEKSYKKYIDKYVKLGVSQNKAEQQALEDVERDFRQGVQGWELAWNTVNSARGSYIFISCSFGLGQGRFAQMATKALLNVRKGGQGVEGNKKPVLFPKLIFLYDENVHGEGKPLEELFNCAIECSKKAMYPDYESLSGTSYLSNVYQTYGTPITSMGCLQNTEIVTYKYKDKLYVESIGRLWNRMEEDFGLQLQPNQKDYYIQPVGLQIYDTKKGFINVTCLNRNTQDKWCQIKLNNGRNLICTNDHPFETENRGVVLAESLRNTDIIACNYDQFNQETINQDTDLAYLYGSILCDGCYDKGLFLSFGKDEHDIMDYLITCFEKLCGVIPKKIYQQRGVKGDYYDLRLYSRDGAPIKDLCYDFINKFGGLQKIYRHIPNEVFSWNREAKVAFLAGMIDADGYIHNDNKKKTSTLQLGSINRELALQQMALLQSLDISARIYISHYGRGEDKYRYRVESDITTEIKNALHSVKKVEACVVNDKKVQTGIVLNSVKSVLLYDNTDYSYDVTTESEHFEVNGIYSHNCRSFLSPWFERGGMKPADENDKPVYVGRGNIGVISLNLPMIYMKSLKENKDFYEVLDYYLEMIRQLHIRTFNYLGEMKASVNPIGYCEGGFFGGHLQPNDKVKPVLKSFTTSFGITALNELQELYNQKSLVQDGEFALKTMKYIANKVEQFKQEDGILHSCYGTPAESLCGTQVEQFRQKYGIVENVSDRGYMTNSFHCQVSEDITPIQKQDYEERFWDLCKGGQIQYTRFYNDYNTESFKQIIRRGMKKGFYSGVNLKLSYCEECGHEELGMEVCPKCGSKNITTLDRISGYLGFTRVNGDTRMNKGKLAEIHDRKSM